MPKNSRGNLKKILESTYQIKMPIHCGISRTCSETPHGLRLRDLFLNTIISFKICTTFSSCDPARLQFHGGPGSTAAKPLCAESPHDDRLIDLSLKDVMCILRGAILAAPYAGCQPFHWEGCPLSGVSDCTDCFSTASVPLHSASSLGIFSRKVMFSTSCLIPISLRLFLHILLFN